MSKSKLNDSKKFITIGQSFKRILPSQCIICFAAFMPSLLSTFLAGNFLDSNAIAAISYADPLKFVVSSIAGIISIGCSILVGRYAGQGDTKNINSVFSVSVVFSVVVGLLFWLCIALFSDSITTLLEVDKSTILDFKFYLYGWSLFLIPGLLEAVLLVFLQVYSQQKSIFCYIPLFIFFDVLFGYVLTNLLNLGTLGIGLAVSFATIIAVVFLYVWLKLTCDNIRFSLRTCSFKNLKALFLYGCPFGIGYICFAIKDIIRNILAAELGGVNAVAAIGVTTSAASIFEAIPQGIAGTVVIIASLYIGARNKEKLVLLVKYISKWALVIAAITTVIWIGSCYWLCSIFCDDTDVLQIAFRFALFYAPYIFIYVFPDTLLEIYQSLERILFTNILYVLYYLGIQLVAMYCLIPIMGLDGIWLSFLVNEIVIIIIILIVCAFKKKGLPNCIEDLLWLGDDFSKGKSIMCYAQNITDVVNCSNKINEFLINIGVDKKTSYLMSLTTEEIGVDVFENYCSEKHKSKCIIEYTVVSYKDTVELQISDNADKFSPQEYERIMSSEDKVLHFGLRWVVKMIDDITYQNAICLNIYNIVYKRSSLNTSDN